MAKYFLYFVVFLLHQLILQGNSGPLSFYDTPMCRDINTFLDAIENAVNFTKTYEVDDNTALGLLILRANMMHIARFIKLPSDLKERINKLGTAIEYTVYNNDFPLTGAWRDDLGITNIFNLTDAPLLDQKPIEAVELRFPSVKEYERDIEAVDDAARLSDNCLGEFTKLTHVNSNAKCPINEKCLTYLKYGPDYGYGMTHRLLFMILANSRGCYVFQPLEDKRMKHMFCSAMYDESRYLAYNNFLSIDLMMESVCLCASLGYTQFLSRKWFSKTLTLQSDYGCFENTQFPKISRRNYDINVICAKNETYARFLKERNCDPHFTIVSMAALVIGTRFTMQKCYGILKEVQSLE